MVDLVISAKESFAKLNQYIIGLIYLVGCNKKFDQHLLTYYAYFAGVSSQASEKVAGKAVD